MITTEIRHISRDSISISWNPSSHEETIGTWDFRGLAVAAREFDKVAMGGNLSDAKEGSSGNGNSRPHCGKVGVCFWGAGEGRKLKCSVRDRKSVV